jgi:hypothetical protein
MKAAAGARLSVSMGTFASSGRVRAAATPPRLQHLPVELGQAFELVVLR